MTSRSGCGDMRGILSALLRRAPAATRACPLPSGRLAILQGTSALIASAVHSPSSTSPSSLLLLPEAEWRSIRDDILLSTLAAVACGGKKDRLVLWDAFLAPELHDTFPTLLPGFRPRLAPSGVLLSGGGSIDWLVLALFPVQKGALSLTVVDGEVGGTERGEVVIVYRSLGGFDARGVVFNRLKKALYHGWTNRNRDEGTPKGRSSSKGRPTTSGKALTPLLSQTDKASEWLDLCDGVSLLNTMDRTAVAADNNARFQFADAVVDPSLIGYVEAALRNYAQDARTHLKTVEDTERERLRAAVPLPSAPPLVSVSSSIPAGGGSRFRKKASVDTPQPPTPTNGVPVSTSRFKKRATTAPLVSGVAPSSSSMSVSPGEKPAYQVNEPQVDRRTAWSDKVRDGARSPFRKLQGGYNLGYYLNMTDDLDTVGGPYAWQALLPLAAKDGHLKNPVLLSPAASEAEPDIPQQSRVVELLLDDRPSSFQSARRYGRVGNENSSTNTHDERHIEHVYTHQQLRQLIRRIHRLKGHMPAQRIVPVYIDAEFGHTRFNKSISLLQLCYYSKPPHGDPHHQLVQRVAIIDVHQLLNTESLAWRRYSLLKRKRRHSPSRPDAADVPRSASSHSLTRPPWIPSVRWVRGRRAACILQQGLFGNPLILKVLHGSGTDLILLFRSLGCHLLAPIPPSRCAEPQQGSCADGDQLHQQLPLWSATPFLDTGSIDMKLRFIIWDALSSMAQAGNPTTKLDLPIPTCVTSNVGLAGLMKRFNTGHLKSLFLTIQNWDRRPLQEELLQYAADDVRYLHEIFFGLLKGVAVAAASVDGDRAEFEKMARPLLQRILNDLSHFMSASDGFDNESQIASTSTSTTGFRRNASVSYSSPTKALVIEGGRSGAVGGEGVNHSEEEDALLERAPLSSKEHRSTRADFRPYIFGPEATLLVADALNKWVEEQRKKEATLAAPPPVHKGGTVYVLSEEGSSSSLYPDVNGVQRIPMSGLLSIVLNADNALLFYAMPELRPTPELIKAGKSPKEVHFSSSEASPQGRTLRSKHINVRKLVERVQGSVVRAISKKITDVAMSATNSSMSYISASPSTHQAAVTTTIGSLLRECATITDPTLLAHGFNAGPMVQLGSGGGGGNASEVVATYQLDQLKVGRTHPSLAVDVNGDTRKERRMVGGCLLSPPSHVLLPSLLLDPITRPPSLLGTLMRWAGHVHRVSKYNITNLEEQASVVNSNKVGVGAFKIHQQREVLKQHQPPVRVTPSLSSWGSANSKTTASPTLTPSPPIQGKSSSQAAPPAAEDGQLSSPPPSPLTLGLVKAHLDGLVVAWEEASTCPSPHSNPTWLNTNETLALFKNTLVEVSDKEKERRAAIRDKFTPRVDDVALGCLSSMKEGLRVHRNSLISTTKKVLQTHSDAVCRDILIDFHKKYDESGGDSVRSASTSQYQLASFIMSNHLARSHFNLVLTVAVHSILQCYSLLLQVPALPSASLSMMNFRNEIYDPQADNHLSKHESIKLKRKQHTMSRVRGDGVGSSDVFVSSGVSGIANDNEGGLGEDNAESNIVTFAAFPPFPAPVLSHQFEMVVIEVMKRLEENERIIEVKKKGNYSTKGGNGASAAAMSVMGSRFSTRDAKDVMRSFLGSPSNYQPTRKLVEGEMAAMAVSGVGGLPVPWASTIAAKISSATNTNTTDMKSDSSSSSSSSALGGLDVALVTSRLYYSIFASMLSAAVQRTYLASEYTLSLLTHFQISVAGVAQCITNSVLCCTVSGDADAGEVNPSSIRRVLIKLSHEIEPHSDAGIGAKQLGSTLTLLDQYHPARYSADDGICGAVRASLLEGISRGSGGGGGDEQWSHESIVALLIADYTLATEEVWSLVHTSSEGEDLTALKAFTVSLLQDVFIPLSNNYVSPQIVEGLSVSFTGAVSVTSTTHKHTPLLTSLTMGMLFAKYYHPLVRSRVVVPNTTSADTPNNQDASTSTMNSDDVERVALANAKNSQMNTADDIVVAQRKNYGIPLPCLITRSEFACVVVELFALKQQPPQGGGRCSPTTISSILRRAHTNSHQRGHVPPSPWLSAHEQHLVQLLLSRF